MPGLPALRASYRRREPFSNNGGVRGTLVATPRIIHQIWKQGEVPDEFRALVASIRTHHPNFEYRLWTDRELDALIEERAPQFVNTYRSFKKDVERVDFARYLI